MFQLLQPIALMALAGIIIPLVIHLWNIKQGKTLKIGSIALLKENARQPARSLQITDVLLLILRSLLLVLLAFMLTKPVWENATRANKTAGWILMEKERVSQTYDAFKTTIDSLLQNGYEPHAFQPDFPAIQLEDSTTSDQAESDHISYWSLLTALDSKISSQFPVYLFTTNSLTRFEGSKPHLTLNLHWETFTPADSVSHWIASAYFTATDSLRVISAGSQPTGTAYSVSDLIPLENINNKFRLSFRQGTPVIGFANDSTNIPVDTTSNNITIYASENRQDATYLVAAIHTLQPFTKRRIALNMTRNINQIPNACSLLFWLSEVPLPDSIKGKLQAEATIFQYKSGKTENLAAGTLLQPATLFANEKIPLYRRIQPKSDTGAIVWTDGYGNPLLTKEIIDQKTVYGFYSRFDPEWNNLVWSEQFVPWLMPIILHLEPDYGKFGFITKMEDRRTIAVAQMQPARSQSVNNQSVKITTASTDLNPILWVMAFILFVTERILSGKKKKV